jgi:hypothetical protein
MSDVAYQSVFDRLSALEDALRADASASAAPLLYQCDRLAQAVRHSHAEAIRFAAYTINHLASAPGSGIGDAVRERVADLRAALATAGHTF